MTIAEAQATLGSLGNQLSHTAGKFAFETYRWESGSVTVTVTFENGRLFSKGETGL